MSTKIQTFFICDRCGNTKEQTERNIEHHYGWLAFEMVNKVIGRGTDGKKDLCGTCYEDLRLWYANPTELPRCEVTGNPVGTDTWKVGYICKCKSCSQLIPSTKGKIHVK